MNELHKTNNHEKSPISGPSEGLINFSSTQPARISSDERDAIDFEIIDHKDHHGSEDYELIELPATLINRPQSGPPNTAVKLDTATAPPNVPLKVDVAPGPVPVPPNTAVKLDTATAPQSPALEISVKPSPVVLSQGSPDAVPISHSPVPSFLASSSDLDAVPLPPNTAVKLDPAPAPQNAPLQVDVASGPAPAPQNAPLQVDVASGPAPAPQNAPLQVDVASGPAPAPQNAPLQVDIASGPAPAPQNAPLQVDIAPGPVPVPQNAPLQVDIAPGPVPVPQNAPLQVDVAPGPVPVPPNMEVKLDTATAPQSAPLQVELSPLDINFARIIGRFSQIATPPEMRIPNEVGTDIGGHTSDGRITDFNRDWKRQLFFGNLHNTRMFMQEKEASIAEHTSDGRITDFNRDWKRQLVIGYLHNTHMLMRERETLIGSLAETFVDANFRHGVQSLIEFSGITTRQMYASAARSQTYGAEIQNRAPTASNSFYIYAAYGISIAGVLCYKLFGGDQSQAYSAVPASTESAAAPAQPVNNTFPPNIQNPTFYAGGFATKK